jgi:hypothetical protein
MENINNNIVDNRNNTHEDVKAKLTKDEVIEREVNRLKNNHNEIINVDNKELVAKLADELKKAKPVTMKFGYVDTILNAACPKCIKKKETQKLMQIYNDINKYVNEKLDIAFYLKTIEKLERLKLLMLNGEQNISFSFIKNPDLGNEEELNCFELQLNQNKVNDAITLINYYINRAREDKLDGIDTETLPLLDPIVKKYMMK